MAGLAPVHRPNTKHEPAERPPALEHQRLERLCVRHALDAARRALRPPITILALFPLILPHPRWLPKPLLFQRSCLIFGRRRAPALEVLPYLCHRRCSRRVRRAQGWTYGVGPGGGCCAQPGRNHQCEGTGARRPSTGEAEEVRASFAGYQRVAWIGELLSSNLL
jgi:hypothetical protein